MIDIKTLAKTLAGLTSEEILALSAELKETYGFTPPTAQTSAPAEVETVAKEKTQFNVVLTEAGARSLHVVKAWNKLGAVGSLIACKKIIDSAPVTLKENISNEEAQNIKTELETEGAVISIE